MQQIEGLFKGKEDLELFYRCWLPDREPNAVVVLVHGFSDHCDRHANLVNYLVRRRYALYGYDLRGHGQSPGRIGYVQHFDDYRQDTRMFINLVAARHPELPLYLFGQSMGGLIALDQALRYPEAISGVIASSPHLGNPPISPIKTALSRVISRFWPTLSMHAGLDATALSRDISVVQAYQEDPLVHGRGTVRLSTELEAAVAETQANAHHLKPPLFIYHGTADRLTSAECSLRFYNNVKNKEKTVAIYEGGYHECHNDIHHERVVIEVAQWIEAQMIKTKQQQERQDQVDG